MRFVFITDVICEGCVWILKQRVVVRADDTDIFVKGERAYVFYKLWTSLQEFTMKHVEV